MLLNSIIAVQLQYIVIVIEVSYYRKRGRANIKIFNWDPRILVILGAGRRAN